MLSYSLISIVHAQFGTLPQPQQKLKTKLQTPQNKFLRFCLQLDNRAHVGITKFKEINWLPVNYRFRQSLIANMFKFFDDKCPFYMKDVFDTSYVNQALKRNYNMKLSHQGEATMVNALYLFLGSISLEQLTQWTLHQLKYV